MSDVCLYLQSILRLALRSEGMPPAEVLVAAGYKTPDPPGRPLESLRTIPAHLHTGYAGSRRIDCAADVDRNLAPPHNKILDFATDRHIDLTGSEVGCRSPPARHQRKKEY